MESERTKPEQLQETPKDIVEVKVHFPNDDVPKFLKRLRKLENRPSTITEPTAHYSGNSQPYSSQPQYKSSLPQ
tara:strand:+ start:5563 stop:5784 length:222 start_codon:yes stop_codon:yes gene_type:complete